MATEEYLCDLQLRLGVGDSLDKPQTIHSSEKEESKELTEYYSSETMCLSRTRLQKVPEHLLKNITLKYLYLEGNELCSIPPSFFTSLPSLLWLDLRCNQIKSLPAEIGLHRSLRTLLLEANPITELPPELGNVLSLTGLNLRDCPISYPPQDVLQRGVQSILQFLRRALAQRPISATKSLPDLPMVEKLQLELMGSSLEEEEMAEEEDLQRFRDLKHKMSLMDKAELETAPQEDTRPKPRPLPTMKKKKVTTKATVTPQLHLFDTQHWNKPEERRQAVMKELKEKQAILDQRRKSQEALRKWWTQAKNTQQSGHKQKKQERHRQKEEAGTDTKPGAEDSSDLPHPQTCSLMEYKESSGVCKLREQIYAIVQKMVERRRDPKGTREEQIEAAEQDMKEMRKLQAQILDMKRGRGFALYTGHGKPGFTEK